MLLLKARRPSTARLLLIATAAAIIALFALSAAGSSAATKKAKHKVDLVVKAARVATTGASNTVAGTFSGPPYGSGAVVYKTQPAGNDIAAKYTGYTSRGTIRGTTLVTPTPQADGSIVFAGTLQVKSGTGRYRGAKGKDLKVTGNFVPAENVFTFQIKGTVRY
jgi:hypothetical protein